MTDNPSLDLDALGELKAVMEGDFPILIEAFFNDSSERIEQMEEHVAASNSEELRRTAHSFKGSSGNVGALKLQELCRQMEAAGKAGSFDNTAVLVEAIKEEYDVVKGLLAKEIDL